MNAAPSTIPSTIEVAGLRKNFGELTAVDNVSFQVRRGEAFGFLGPNGAGKSTTIRMLTGVLRPDAGAAEIAGRDIRLETEAAKSEVGIVPEQFNAYLDLTGWKNLMLAGELYGVPKKTRHDRAEELLRSFGLFEWRDRTASEYSKGMKQRLMLTMALLHDPQVLFLDEPITGLDVTSQQLIRTRIEELNQAGRTVFLTTHDIDEADRLCDRVAIIDEGKIAAIDSPEALKQTIERTRGVEVSFDQPIEREALRELTAVEAVQKRGDTFILRTPDPDAVVRSIVRLSEGRGAKLRKLETLGPSLEDVFTTLTEGNE